VKELVPQLNTFLVLLIVFQGLIFCIIFFRVKRNRPEKILGYYEVAYILAYIIMLFYYLNERKLFIHAYYVLIPIFALFPVLFYLYIKKIARGGLGKTELLHFIFPVLLLITNLSFLPFLSFPEKWAIIIEQSVSDDQDLQQQLFLVISRSVYPLLLTVQPFIYIIFCGKEIWHFRKKIKNEYSFSEDISLKWLIQLLIVFVILFTISLLIKKPQFSYAFILIINVVIGVNAIKHIQTGTLSEDALNSEKPSVKNNDLHKYAASCLSEEYKAVLYEKLKTYLETEKKYTCPELRLTDVADDLSTNRQYLSQVINEQTGENFYHFINRFRIENFIQKVDQDSSGNLSIEGVALSVGFKSKSSFYSAFKKMKGCTPKTYFRKNT
jgi:AraC-like DNA-binding protein